MRRHWSSNEVFARCAVFSCNVNTGRRRRDDVTVTDGLLLAEYSFLHAADSLLYASYNLLHAADSLFDVTDSLL